MERSSIAGLVLAATAVLGGGGLAFAQDMSPGPMMSPGAMVDPCPEPMMSAPPMASSEPMMSEAPMMSPAVMDPCATGTPGEPMGSPSM